MRFLRRYSIAAISAIAALTALNVPARADTPGVGIASLRVTGSLRPFAGNPGSVDRTVLKGPLVVNGKAVEVNVTIGPFRGQWDWCGSLRCGYVGEHIDLTGVSAPVTGTIGDGSAVTGTCHDGRLDVGYFAGASLLTNCDVQIRGVTTGPFVLHVGAPAGLGLSDTSVYYGTFCADLPGDPCVVGSVDVPNPGLIP